MELHEASRFELLLGRERVDHGGASACRASKRISSVFSVSRLARKVDPEAAKVDFRNGLLKLRLPKRRAPPLPSWLMG